MKILLFLTLALADTGTPVDPETVVEVVPVTPEVLCEFALASAVSDLLAANPLAVETCEPWNPATMYDPNLSTCSFWCGSVFHVEAL